MYTIKKRNVKKRQIKPSQWQYLKSFFFKKRKKQKEKEKWFEDEIGQNIQFSGGNRGEERSWKA